MNLFTWADKKIKAQTVWDIGILKIFCCLVGMIIGAYISAFVLRSIMWFVGVSIILCIVLLVRFFTLKSGS